LEVQFRNKKLRRCFEKHKEAARKWGSEVARKYVQRVQVLQNMRSPDDLDSFRQFRHHELKGERSGEHVISLTARYRLHFTVQGNVVTILEVTKHYGD